jgi:hypothetical protein
MKKLSKGEMLGGIYRYGHEVDRKQVAGKVGEIQAKQFQ